MKLRIFSDIHLDHYIISNKQLPNFWYPPEMPDDKDTVLVIAGDIWIGSKWIKWKDFSWIEQVAPRFKQVLIVLGNHCLWPMGDLTIRQGAAKCNTMLQEMSISNVTVLDSTMIEIDNIIFVGSTLWTDMDNYSPFAMMNVKSAMNYDGKIIYETGPNGYMAPFTSHRWCDTHKKQRDYIDFIARNNSSKKIVVITHHMPLLTLIDPIYQNNSSNAYYSSDLSDLILDNTNIALWCFGHSHYPIDEMFGDTRMVNQAIGYPGEHKIQQGYIDEFKIIEILG